jgi:hypothetical protein
VRAKLLAGVLLIAVVALALGLNRARATDFSLPDLSGSCTSANSAFSTAITADTLTNAYAFQVNITFDNSQVRPMSYAMGSAFAGGTTLQKNATGTYAIGFTFQGSNPGYSASSTTTLFTINWKTKVYHATTTFSFVTTGALGSLLLDNNLSAQSFTTTNGVYTCNI